ncbi:MAG: hypothetical protein AAGC61_15825, partial [Microbacterium sp.]
MLKEHLDIGVTTRAQSDSGRGIHSHRSRSRTGGSAPGTRESDRPIGSTNLNGVFSRQNKETTMAVVTIRQLLDSGV